MNLRKAKMIAKDLMNHFGLDLWAFRFDRAKVRFGMCSAKEKVISISRPLAQLNGEAELIDTVLHEIAHALAGAGVGHGRLWRATALEIGATPNRCYKSGSVQAPTRKYVGTCPSCYTTVKRHTRRRIACSRCCGIHNGGKFDADFLFKWTVA